MKMKIADNRTTLVPIAGTSVFNVDRANQPDDRAGDEQEVAVHRPAIAQVAQQDDDEDSRERQLQADAEDVHESPLSGVDRTGVARAGLFADATGPLLRAPCGAQ